MCLNSASMTVLSGLRWAGGVEPKRRLSACLYRSVESPCPWVQKLWSHWEKVIWGCIPLQRVTSETAQLIWADCVIWTKPKLIINHRLLLEQVISRNLIVQGAGKANSSLHLLGVWICCAHSGPVSCIMLKMLIYSECHLQDAKSTWHTSYIVVVVCCC